MKITSMLQDVYCGLTCIAFLVESYRPYNYAERVTVALGTTSYFIIDSIFNTKIDARIHHAIALTTIGVGSIWEYPQVVSDAIINIEWTTGLFILMNYVNGIYLIITQLLFALLFFELRIHRWYVILDQYSNDLLYVQLFPVVALYTLNVYWGVLIIKKALRFLKHKDLIPWMHRIVSYTIMISSVVLSYRVYPNHLGLQLCSYSSAAASYLYHNDRVTMKESKWLMTDITMVHIGQIGSIVKILNPIWSSICICLHTCTVLFIYMFNPVDVMTVTVPVFTIDIILCMFYLPNSIELYTILILSIFVIKLNPFYDLSYVATHLLICWYLYAQTTTIKNNLNLEYK